MPRLSLYRQTKSHDYRFFDRVIKEQFSVGGTDLYVHKYLAPKTPATSQDFSQPAYDKSDPRNIQDLLFLENRDRKYDPNIYRIRGHYNVQNLDFDLSQFGLFLSNDTIFITVHYNDMIDQIGRKLMTGDVLELPHLTDYHPLNDTIPISLRRYYQITDANWASEGFSQTWYPHLWRIKCEPLIDSQEFNEILSQPANTDNWMGQWAAETTYQKGYTVTSGNKVYESLTDVPAGISPPDEQYWKLISDGTLSDIVSQYKQNLAINDAMLEEASRLVPSIGYDRSQLYLVPTEEDGVPAPPINLLITAGGGPVRNRGTVVFVNNPDFVNSSAAIKISSAALQSMMDMTADSMIGSSIDRFISVSLQAMETQPEKSASGTGSGRVSGDLVLAATALATIKGPYGTADNTYSRADQHLSTQAKTLGKIPRGESVIQFIATPTGILDIITGLKIIAENVPNDPFQKNTRILRIEQNGFASGTLTKVTLTKPLLYDLESNTVLTISHDFDGVITDPNIMDYRADCDPRFQFIRRSTPRSFGYISGYASGDGTAPNGEPTGAGIEFPANPTVGDYFLRLDYLPQQLFRWNGQLWVQISSRVRTAPGFGPDDESQLSTFINNTEVLKLNDGTTMPSKTSLSQAFKIRPD